VVHFDTLGLAQYRPLVRSSGTVLNHHNVESSMMALRALNEPNLLRRQYYSREARKLRQAEQRWCPQFVVNLVVSPQDGQLLSDCAPGIKAKIVPNGVDTDYFTPRPDPGGKTLLFCGGLDWYPNRDAITFFFDTIWPKLTAGINDIEIYVVGRKPPQWLKRLGDTDRRVHVTGFVPDVRPYFRKATAYVCPIRNGGGTRLKILDAFAMGMPLIATPFACSGLSVEKGKHVLFAHTPPEFVYQIERVLSNRSLRNNLGLQARNLVCRLYSWTVISQSLLQAYEVASIALAPPR
jgi:glycosyltransferase involved in cell wall biosynthesis